MGRLGENELMMNSNPMTPYKSGLYNSAVSNNSYIRENNGCFLGKPRNLIPNATMLGFSKS